MHPIIVIHWPAVLGAMVLAFVFGFLWYGPLLGKKWAGYMGMDINQKPDSKVMRKALLLQVIGLFLTSYVLIHTTNVWRDSAWGLGEDGPNYQYGFYSGFFTWIGFYVPMQLSKVAWEKRPWGLFFINAGHDFINLQLITQVLAHWR